MTSPHATPPADPYRGLFTFGVFNAIQSTCFDSVSLSATPADPQVLTLPQVDTHCTKSGRISMTHLRFHC